ncbi:hypothetical protein ACRBEJ_14070 [Yersinia proxima]|uniref:hypothetical protein n=1 Tax=Yersinia proxima TaxID=2890316 RepID=UPI003D68CF63
MNLHQSVIRVIECSQHTCDLKDVISLYPIDFKPQEGGKGGHPDELTSVSDSGD